MGIIQRQSIKGSIYTYVGAGLGFLNLAILAPKIFTTDQIGLTQVLVSIATIFAQMGTLGFNSVILRLFPYFRSKEDKHNGFLFIQTMVGLAGFLVVLVVYFLLRDLLIDRNIEKSVLFTQYIDFLIPLFLFLLAHILMDSYNRVLYNATLGTFFREILVRLGNLGIIILFYYEIISFRTYVYLFVSLLAIPPLLISVYLYINGNLSFRPKLAFIDKAMKKQMIDVAIFGIIGGMSGIALANIDKYMVTDYMGLGAAGVYSIAFYFGTLILLPSRALNKISVTLLAQSWKENDVANIESIYKKSCLNQYVVGGLLFILLVANLGNVFQILPAEFESGRGVIIFIGLANVLNMISGVSMNIIGTSVYYRYQHYWMILFVVLIITTNILFIPVLGIPGAALASLVSTFILTIVKFWFLKWKFGFQPYSMAILIITLISGGTLALNYLIPVMAFWPDLLLRSAFIAIVFAGLIYITKVSEELNSIVRWAFKLIKPKR